MRGDEKLDSALYVMAASANTAALCLFFWARYRIFERSRGYTGSYLSRAGTGGGLACIGSAAYEYSGRLTSCSAAALLLTIFSVVLFVSAVREFRGVSPAIALADVAPKLLIMTGPYGFVRHPLYLAYILNWLSAAVLYHNLVVGVVFFVMVFLYWSVARKEETALLGSSSADDYREYCNRVPMLLPRLWYGSR